MAGNLPLAFGADLAGNIINALFGNQGNQKRENLTREGNQILEDQKGEVSDVFAPYTAPNWLYNQGNNALQGANFDPNAIFGNTKPGGLSTFQGAYQPFDWDALMGRITSTANSGRVDPNTVAGTAGDYYGGQGFIKDAINTSRVSPDQAAATVGGYYDREPVRLSDYLSSELNKTASASRARLGSARQTALGQALASGGSLESAAPTLENLNLSEAQARGAQASTASAQAEALRNQTALAKAHDQAGAYSTFGGLGAQRDIAMAGELNKQDISRAGTMADVLTKMLGLNADQAARLSEQIRLTGTSQADTGLTAAKYQGDLATSDAQEQDRVNQALWNALAEKFGLGVQSGSFAAGNQVAAEQMRAGLAGQQASNLAGLDVVFPQFTAGQDLAQGLYSIAAAHAAQPPKQSPFQGLFGIQV